MLNQRVRVLPWPPIPLTKFKFIVYSEEPQSISSALLGNLKTEPNRVLVIALSSPFSFFRQLALPSAELWSIIQRPKLIYSQLPTSPALSPINKHFIPRLGKQVLPEITTGLCSQAVGRRGAFAYGGSRHILLTETREVCTGLGRYQGVTQPRWRLGGVGRSGFFLENLLFQMSLESKLGMNSTGKEKALQSKRGECKLTLPARMGLTTDGFPCSATDFPRSPKCHDCRPFLGGCWVSS